MVEMDIIYRLSILSGFMLASIIAILIGALIFALRHCCKTAMKDLENMMDDLEKEERKCLDESNRS